MGCPKPHKYVEWTNRKKKGTEIRMNPLPPPKKE